MKGDRNTMNRPLPLRRIVAAVVGFCVTLIALPLLAPLLPFAVAIFFFNEIDDED